MDRSSAAIFHALVCGCAVFLSACATDVANRYYAPRKYPPRQPATVDLLSGAPRRPYEVIADLQCRDESPAGMRKRAAAIGADAVIVTCLGGDYLVGDQWAGRDSMSGTYSRIVGTAIIYKRKP